MVWEWGRNKWNKNKNMKETLISRHRSVWDPLLAKEVSFLKVLSHLCKLPYKYILLKFMTFSEMSLLRLFNRNNLENFSIFNNASFRVPQHRVRKPWNVSSRRWKVELKNRSDESWVGSQVRQVLHDLLMADLFPKFKKSTICMWGIFSSSWNHHS